MTDVQTYSLPNGWVVSEQSMWLPGIYDSDESARHAVHFSYQVLSGLTDRISSVHGENRMITMEDFPRGLTYE